MKLVETLSTTLKTTSWIWGGFTADIYVGRLLREHSDLDYLTLNLHQLKPQFAGAFARQGWQVQYLDNNDLKLRKNGIKVHLGHIEFAAEVKWTHNGEKGYICFPISWLRFEVARFYGIELHVVEPEFQYILKEHPELLNPDWILRDKDKADKAHLRDILEKKRLI